MPEWLVETFKLFGGISVVVCTTLAFCKGIMEKFIHTQIEKSAEKELESAKSKFSRSFTAYEILLKKEFDYYENIDKIYANVIVDVQDVGFYSTENSEIEKKAKCERIKSVSLNLLQAILDLKNLNLLYQVYVPVEIFSITGEVVVAIQNNCDLIAQTAKNVLEEKACDEEKIRGLIEEVLRAICMSNACIRSRLETLSK